MDEIIITKELIGGTRKASVVVALCVAQKPEGKESVLE